MDHLSRASDTELVRRAQSKRLGWESGAEAMGELYNRYHERIFRYVWSRVYDRQLAEDLTGEVFYRMVTNLAKYRWMEIPFQAWLYRIAHNLMVDYFRKAGNKRELPIELVDYSGGGVDGPAQTVEKRLHIEQVLGALEDLKPIQQEVILLRFLMGLSLREVASILGKTVGAVKAVQHRGLMELRTVLEFELNEESDE